MKDRKIYKTLTIIGACFLFCGIPINRFYLGLTKGIFLRTITLNYFLIGAWIDLFFMDKTFDEAMAKRGFLNSNIRNEQGK
jgi:TM2 domain-containing membrane protein YozV